MRSLLVLLLLSALALAAACSSAPRRDYPGPQAALPDCEDTDGYPPCIYHGVAPYQGYEDFYPTYDYPYFPGTGVVVIPEPVPVPTPKPKPPKKPPPPPKHHRQSLHPCHPQPGRPCP